MENNDDFKNFIKMQELLKRSAVVLRHIFSNRWKLMTGKEWINSEENGKDFINGKGYKVYHNSKSIQKLYLESGDINNWDLTLISNVLQSVQFSIFGQKDKLYVKQVKEVNKKFEILTKIRNKCAHNPNMCINKDEFNIMWNELCLVLVSFGESEEELELLKNKTIIKEIDKNEGIKESNEKASEMIKIGDKYMNEKKFKEAVNEYSNGLAVKGVANHYQSVLHSKRCDAYLSLYDYEKGIINKSLSDSLDKNDMRYYALMDAKKCLEYSPMWWRSYHLMGCSYHKFNNYSKAIYNFDRAIALEPTKQEIISARDLSRLQRMRDNREEHIDDRYLPQSTEDCIRKFNETGHHVTPEMVKSMEDVFDKFGDSFADVMKGDRYRDGRDVVQDYEMASKFYGKAAKKEDPEGIYNLALLTRDGKGVHKDIQMAVKMFQRCADLPLPSSLKPEYHRYKAAIAESQNSLGLHYQAGIGVVKNSAFAEIWFRRASENGSANAAHNLGLMYLNGKEVKLNLEKAKQYLELAAIRKDAKAWESLAFYYLTILDTENARISYNRAIANGCTHADLFRKEFEEQISSIENNMNVKDIEKYESQNGLNSYGLTLKDRSIRMKTHNHSQEDKQLLTDCLNLQINKNVGLPAEVTEGFSKFDLKTIIKYAKNGSVIAKRMETAMNHTFVAINALQMFDSNERKGFEIEFIQNFANAIRAEHQVSILPMHLISKAIEMVNNVLKSEANSKSQLDIDSRVCYILLHMNSLKETTEFLKECTKKYSKEWIFFKFLGDLHAFASNYSEALIVFNKAFKLLPNDYDLTFERAAIMRLNSNCEPKDIISAYLSFIEIAPIDHRFLPDSYYAIASLEYESYSKMNEKIKKKNHFDDNVLSIVKSYYEKGLNAEKNQLSFYLPYESSNKMTVELIFKANLLCNDFKDNITSIPVNTAVNQLNKGMNDKLSDPFRIELIRDHREYAAQLLTVTQPTPDYIKASILISNPPLRKQKAPKSIIGLKTINIKDLDPTLDHIYEGFVLQITFIEMAVNDLSSIANIIRDENNDIQRFYLYNYKNMNNDSIVQQNYGIGCKVSVMNPYMRMCHDGKPAIRVDDPNSLYKVDHDLRIENMCRYCGAQNAKSRCSRCKIALYCDRECQQNDWLYYRHKFICIKS